MSMTAEDLRSMQEVIVAKRREEASKRKDAEDELKRIRESKTPQELITDRSIAERVDEIFKPADALRDEITQLEVGYQTFAKRAGLQRPIPEGPAPAEALARSVDFNPGGRYTGSEAYTRIRSLAPREGDGGRASSSMFVQAFRQADPVEVMTRAEIRGTRMRSITLTGNLPWSDRQPGYVPLPARTIRLLDLISMANTDSNTVEWIQVTARTDVMAAVAYGSLPASEHAITMGTNTTTVYRLIAWLTATEGNLADVGQLEQIINTDLVGDYNRSLETLIVSGNGTGTILGLANTSGINVQARGSNTALDAAHMAITQIRLAFGEPNAIGLHPTDYEHDFVLAKDSLGDYLYKIGEPPTIWGLQAVVTPVFAQGTGYVADWTIPTLWLREGVSVAASNEHSDYFLRGQVAIKAEGRAAFTVKLPQFVTQLTGL